MHSPVPSKYIFFGDRTTPGGNDYPLAKIINNLTHGKVVQVDKWEDTMKYLMEKS